MSIEHTLDSNDAVVLGPGEGRHLSFLGHLATVKVAAAGTRSMSVVEFLAPKGFGPPEHRHNNEDELFVILEGEITYSLAGDEMAGPAGSVACLPHGVPHTFQVVSETARILNVTTSLTGVPRFDDMVTALGEPTERLTIPEPTYIDPSRVAEVCAAHDIDIVGPPPGTITSARS